MDIFFEIENNLGLISELKSNRSVIDARISDTLSEIQDKVYPIAEAWVESNLVGNHDDHQIDGYLTSCAIENGKAELVFEKCYRGEPHQYFVSLPVKYLCENGVQLIKEDSEKKKVEIESAAKQKELDLLRELKVKYESANS